MAEKERKKGASDDPIAAAAGALEGVAVAG
jgi:hypothetical protein